jgi:hypothetical protein
MENEKPVRRKRMKEEIVILTERSMSDEESLRKTT